MLAIATFGLALTTMGAAQQPRRPGAPAPAPKTPQKAAPAAPRREIAVPFKVGETLTYDVSWSQFVTAGTAVARVVEKKPSNGSTAYTISADGRPIPLVARFYNVYYKMDSLLDAFSGLTQWTSTYSEERGRKRQTNMRFDRNARRVYYDDLEEPGAKQNFAAPVNIQDGLSTLYSVRGRAFRAGERFSIPVADDGAAYTVDFEVGRPERVRVPFGDVEAWNLKINVLNASKEPVANNTAAWISTDARRLPVKLQSELPIGNFVLALREASGP